MCTRHDQLSGHAQRESVPLSNTHCIHYRLKSLLDVCERHEQLLGHARVMINCQVTHVQGWFPCLTSTTFTTGTSTHLLFNCQQLTILLETQTYDYPYALIKTFPNDVLNNQKYVFPVTHLLLKSPIGPLICIVCECISMFLQTKTAKCLEL